MPGEPGLTRAASALPQLIGTRLRAVTGEISEFVEQESIDVHVQG